jgi:hypothetical protein
LNDKAGDPLGKLPTNRRPSSVIESVIVIVAPVAASPCDFFSLHAMLQVRLRFGIHGRGRN